jgi:TfoX/Sxy family transcriptional regulator of competence genes
MASDLGFIDFIVDQMGDAGCISHKKMFGEYAIYCNGKVVALVCDNRLFVKPTDGGRAYIDDLVEAPPYPGAKPYFLIEDAFEDREWIGGLGLIRKLCQRPERAPCRQVPGTRSEHIGICKGGVTPELAACRRSPEGRRPSGRFQRLPLVTDRCGYASRVILEARPESPAAGAA